MKIMDSLVDLIYDKSESFQQVGLRNVVGLLSLGMFVIFVSVTYYFYVTVSDLSKKIKILDDQLLQVAVLQQIDSDVNTLEQEEQAFLASNVLPGNGLESFIEQKLPQGATLDSNWKSQVKTNLWALDSLFEEKKAVLNFSKITTQQLVEFMQSLYTQPAVALREIEINKLADALSVNMVVLYRYKKA